MPETTTVNLKSLLSSVRLKPENLTNKPMLQSNLETIVTDVNAEERFASSIAAVVYNLNQFDRRFDKQVIQGFIADIDKLVEAQINEILHHPEFQKMEATWASIQDLVQNTNFKANITLSLFDVDKKEVYEDLELNLADISGSEIFKKIYVAEYDQFGGYPYGGIIGMFDFANTPADILWLRGIGKIASASHAPFIGNVSPKLFGCDTMQEVNLLRDLEGIFNSPAYSRWNAFRDTEEAVYVGLAMPRYMARIPYNDMTNPAEGIHFVEHVRGDDMSNFVWAPASMLSARVLVKSFEISGWCQHIRGVKGGGKVDQLASYTYNLKGEDELRAPTEISLPDYKEFALSNLGLIPLVHKKGESQAVFFSAQSMKASKRFKDPKDSENSQLVANLSYTFSISRIAHYVKCIMRDNIGSTATAEYISEQISGWVSRFVTTAANPDDLTLVYYPFKAYKVEVNPVEGKIGWYHCNLAVLPHIQFEGMDVDLRVDARLGG